MKKKIIGIFVCTLLITTILPITAMAGDENDPEIRDNLNDQFGALIDHPTRIRTHLALTLLQMNTFDFIDINCSWFYESALEPTYLYTAVKLKDLSITTQRTVYSVHWTYNGKPYCVWSHLYKNGQKCISFTGVDRRLNNQWYNAEVTYDYNRSIITFKIDKKYIGDPQPGDLFTKTYAWTALRLNVQVFTLLFSSGELVKDAAPLIQNASDYGRDYVIQY
jgi:hypothetical protein